MNKPPLFRNANERDEIAWTVRDLTGARRNLAATACDPLLMRYRLPDAAFGLPVMPSQTELTQAQDVLHRVAACHAHLYDQRRRNNDDLLHRHAVDDPSPGELDN